MIPLGVDLDFFLLNEPTLMRANTLTANISLIDGTNVGNGVPADDL